MDFPIPEDAPVINTTFDILYNFKQISKSYRQNKKLYFKHFILEIAKNISEYVKLDSTFLIN